MAESRETRGAKSYLRQVIQLQLGDQTVRQAVNKNHRKPRYSQRPTQVRSTPMTSLNDITAGDPGQSIPHQSLRPRGRGSDAPCMFLLAVIRPLIPSEGQPFPVLCRPSHRRVLPPPPFSTPHSPFLLVPSIAMAPTQERNNIKASMQPS